MVHTRLNRDRTDGRVDQVAIAHAVHSLLLLLILYLIDLNHLIGLDIGTVGIAVFHRNTGVVLGVFLDDHLLAQTVEHAVLTFLGDARHHYLLTVNQHLALLQQDVELRIELGVLFLTGLQDIRHLDALDCA